jgi:oxysterol-binding protein 1
MALYLQFPHEHIANHPVEAARWTQAIARSIEWHRNKDRDLLGQGQSDPAMPPSRRSIDSEQSDRGMRRSSTSIITRARTMSTFPSRNGSMSILAPASAAASKKSRQANSMTSSLGVDTDAEPASINESDVEPELHRITAEPEASSNREPDTDHETGFHSDVADSSSTILPPYTPQFDLHGNATIAQLEATSHLLSDIQVPSNAPIKTVQLHDALRSSMSVVQEMLAEYVRMAGERDDWWKQALEAERRRQRVWEESLRMVVKDGEELERELKTRSRRRSSRLFDPALLDRPVSTIKARRAPEGLPIAESGEDTQTPTADLPTPRANEDLPSTDDNLSLGPLPPAGPAPSRQFSPAMPGSPAYVENDADTDEEDEFFDAIESNNLPNLIVNKSLVASAASKPSPALSLINKKQYEAYAHLRSRFTLDADNRPSTSLWSVLKSSIGKDLTKISFPVYFNEPTSMLQRMVGTIEPIGPTLLTGPAGGGHGILGMSRRCRQRA